MFVLWICWWSLIALVIIGAVIISYWVPDGPELLGRMGNPVNASNNRQTVLGIAIGCYLLMGAALAPWGDPLINHAIHDDAKSWNETLEGYELDHPWQRLRNYYATEAGGVPDAKLSPDDWWAWQLKAHQAEVPEKALDGWGWLSGLGFAAFVVLSLMFVYGVWSAREEIGDLWTDYWRHRALVAQHRREHGEEEEPPAVEGGPRVPRLDRPWWKPDLGGKSLLTIGLGSVFVLSEAIEAWSALRRAMQGRRGSNVTENRADG